MKKLLPYKFDECIAKTRLGNLKSHIVIYKANSLSEEFSIIKGYLYTAELITDTVCSEGANTKHDMLALALLNLHIHAIEFSLKLLIKILVEHRELNCCELILPPPNNHESVRMKHELVNLVNLATRMIPMQNIHTFPNFNEITEFITKLSEYGINSMSVRYIKGKKRGNYNLHRSQTYVNLKKLHENTAYVCNRIIDYRN